MLALSASTRNATRVSPTLMSALAHTHAVAAHNSHSQPIGIGLGLGLSVSSPSNATKSRITVLSGPAMPTADFPNSPSHTTAPNDSNRPTFRRSTTIHRRDSCDAVCTSPASAPVLQCAATLPSKLYSPPRPQTPQMHHPLVIPWVFTPPVSTPATTGHDAHDEDYFPSVPAQSFAQASAWMAGSNQSVNAWDTRPSLATRRRSSTTLSFLSSGGLLVSNNYAATASSYLEARNANTNTTITTIDPSLENVGLGITNMRITKDDSAEVTEMSMHNELYDGDDSLMEDEDGWDADVEMDGDEGDMEFRKLKPCKERIPTPYKKPNKPNPDSWKNLDFIIGQAI